MICAAARRRHPSSVASDSGIGEGPLITAPSPANRETWQGQSQVFSTVFQRTMQPRCGQTAERTMSAPAFGRNTASWCTPCRMMHRVSSRPFREVFQRAQAQCAGGAGAPAGSRSSGHALAHPAARVFGHSRSGNSLRSPAASHAPVSVDQSHVLLAKRTVYSRASAVARVSLIRGGRPPPIARGSAAPITDFVMRYTIFHMTSARRSARARHVDRAVSVCVRSARTLPLACTDARTLDPCYLVSDDAIRHRLINGQSPAVTPDSRAAASVSHRVPTAPPPAGVSTQAPVPLAVRCRH